MKPSTNPVVRFLRLDIGDLTGLSIAAHWSILLSTLQILSLVAAEWISQSIKGLEGLQALYFFGAYFALAIPNAVFVGYVIVTDIAKKRLSLPVYGMALLVALAWVAIVHIANG